MQKHPHLVYKVFQSKKFQGPSSMPQKSGNLNTTHSFLQKNS